jgi:hypothetical protein
LVGSVSLGPVERDEGLLLHLEAATRRQRALRARWS